MKRKRLGEFLKEQEISYIEYVNNNDDFLDGYEHVLIETIDFSRLENLVETKGLSQIQLKNIIKDHCKFEREYHNYCDNSLSFVNINEVENQVSGIIENGIDIFNKLTEGLSDEEISDICSEYTDSTINGDCLYTVPDFSSIQIKIDPEEIQKLIDEAVLEAA